MEGRRVRSAHAEMVHTSSGSGSPRGRPLRARGDGPDSTGATVYVTVSAPRTRRWSAAHPGDGRRAHVRSAHAEMFRTRSPGPPARRCPLRARGDVPLPASPFFNCARSAPRTRRCSARRVHAAAPRRVRSAHAEVFRSPPTASGASRGPLRARGDVPPNAQTMGDGIVSAPRTRRCSVPATETDGVSVARSAHAEMFRCWRWPAP